MPGEIGIEHGSFYEIADLLHSGVSHAGDDVFPRTPAMPAKAPETPWAA
jgi:hypothetical protein